jgi:hypothetical protein
VLSETQQASLLLGAGLIALWPLSVLTARFLQWCDRRRGGAQ